MRLTHLSLTNYRNYARLDVEVPGGAILLLGGNAQGKTSLLEAVYFLATFTSFHATSDRQLINFLAAREPLAVGRIVADFVRTTETGSGPEAGRGNGSTGPASAFSTSSTHHLEVRIIQEADEFNGSPRLRKEVLLDGVKRRANEVVGAFNAVLFLPQMLRVVEGPPEERRRYLNLALSQVLPRYAPALSEYNRALSQRNALLRQLAERGGDVSQLTYWDEQLALYGAELVYARIHAIQELEKLASRLHTELTRDQEVLRLVYQPAYDPLPQHPGQFALPLDAPVDRGRLGLQKIQQGFQESLERLRNEDIARGQTTIGPHRDELRFLGNGIDLGIFGSRGQARTAFLSLKLAEVSWMKDKTGQWPVLLLDEVLAELDTARRADLLQRLSASEQAILTTTDLDLFTEEFSKQAQTWNVESGRLVFD